MKIACLVNFTSTNYDQARFQRQPNNVARTDRHRLTVTSGIIIVLYLVHRSNAGMSWYFFSLYFF